MAESIHTDRGLGLPVYFGRFFFGASALLIFFLVSFWDALGKPFGPGVSCSLAYFFFAIHLLLARNRLSALDPIAWIIVSMLLFYFGVPVAIALLPPGSHTGYDSWRIGLSPSLSRGYAALLLAEVSFIWGVYLAGIKSMSRGPAPESEPDHALADPALLMTLGAMVMILGGIALAGPSVVFGYYDDWWAAKQSGADARWVDMGLIFAMAGIFGILATDHRNRRLRRYFAIAVAGGLAVIIVLKGDRSMLIALGIGSGWCWSQRVSRIRPTFVLVVALAALFTLPLIKEFRGTRSAETYKTLAPVEILGSAFREMGSSANTMVYTLDLIPEIGPYRWGMSYVNALLAAVPNLGLTPGKAFVLHEIDYHPSSWITFHLNRAWFDMGGGYGYAMAAEWYFNFGMPSVFLGMTFFGWLTCRIRNSSQKSALRLVWSAMFFAGMAIYVRNVIGYSLKLAVWPVVGLAIIAGILNLLRGRPRPPLQLENPNGIEPLTEGAQLSDWQRDAR